MTSLPVVQIQATYEGHQPLVSILEGNLDLEQVIVRRNEYAVKAIVPLDILIVATEIYLFEKLVLDPIVKPIAEKFNWVQAVKKYLKPIQPFNLVVQIKDNTFIEAPIGTDHETTAQIWNLIRKTLDILKAERLLDKVTKIRFTQARSGKLLILCYEQNRPTRFVVMNENKTIEITKEQVAELEKPPALEDFIAQVTKSAEAYRDFVEGKSK